MYWATGREPLSPTTCERFGEETEGEAGRRSTFVPSDRSRHASFPRTSHDQTVRETEGQEETEIRRIGIFFRMLSGPDCDLVPPPRGCTSFSPVVSCRVMSCGGQSWRTQVGIFYGLMVPSVCDGTSTSQEVAPTLNIL